MKRYELEYNDAPLATVMIDEEKAAGPIKEMVEFWSSSEEDLKEHRGDYTRAFLARLAGYIARHGGPPEEGEEGWYPLDGNGAELYGIQVTAWSEIEADMTLLHIREVY